VVMILSCIPKLSESNLGSNTDNLDRWFRGVPQSLQKCAEIKVKVMPVIN
jgi:hypothetical protein